MKAKITIGNVSVEAEFFNTPCAKAIYEALPLYAEVNEWGDEFYFSIPLRLPLDETATREVDVGDIGYWPPGSAIAIFFGPTPISEGEKPRPASEVNLIGKVLHDPKVLRMAKGSKRISIERIQGQNL
ncbi:MAG: cyclophilin-like fold protein [Desulfobacterota bacterium]|nr:cyclophilin-like fold protein [Thermodesulfobacteriota bacterium]MDW8002275.1 cyclophilin-like fold protein [Deltaproteobacteria bacterium]